MDNDNYDDEDDMMSEEETKDVFGIFGNGNTENASVFSETISLKELFDEVHSSLQFLEEIVYAMHYSSTKQNFESTQLINKLETELESLRESNKTLSEENDSFRKEIKSLYRELAVFAKKEN